MAAVSSPISLPPPTASFFFPQGFLLGLAAASARSLFTCSMAASTELNATRTSSQSSAKPSVGTRNNNKRKESTRIREVCSSCQFFLAKQRYFYLARRVSKFRTNPSNIKVN